MSEAQAQGQVTAETADTQVEAKPSGATAPEGYVPQKDVSKIAANEKREGKASAINELLEKTGAESIDDVLAAYSEYQGIREATESEADKARTAAEKADARAKAAEGRYTSTLRDFALRDALRDAGVAPESLGFVMRGIDKSQLAVDKDGNVAGVEEAVDAAREEAPVLFGATERPRINAPQTTGTGVASARPNGQTPEEQHAQWLVNLLGQ